MQIKRAASAVSHSHKPACAAMLIDQPSPVVIFFRQAAHLSAILAVMVFGVSCRATAPMRHDRAAVPVPAELSTPGEAISAALSGLQVAGIPEPPLGRDATRADRERFLLAANRTVEALRRLAVLRGGAPPLEATLLAPDRSGEVLALSKVLAVELADAIDRSDPVRAKIAITAAVNYADYVSTESLAAAVAAGGVADSVVLGLKSVPGRLDARLTDALLSAIETGRQVTPAGDPAAAELRRLSAWREAAAATQGLVPLEVIVAAADGSGRTPVSAQVIDELKVFAKSTSGSEGAVPAQVYADEASVVLGEVTRFLRAAEQGVAADVVVPDAKKHPIACLYLGRLRATLESGVQVYKMKAESLQMMSLAVRILAAAETPTRIEDFGSEAISPVSGLVFEYRKTPDGFELVRPRAPR